MTITEVVVSVWLLSVIGTASLLGWSQTVLATKMTSAQRAADDCADNAAETYLAGQVATSETMWHGLTCQVQLLPAQDSEQGVMTIVARVGDTSQTLWIPQRGF
ncbi:hypothetical protein [Alicyclobacillus sp. ALC3]|uniref:hypothetical protein n=1 Tax=Alicyclobacillus sp. ALC3 TaxID=2796143 RepID=UPI002379907D|nr:hypothetical protein [Alicyclobacillus sp. ALC3]WDL97007.1 hypothetical protein JC200_22480 [Alicyclobacillus sp. ALC3]